MTHLLGILPVPQAGGTVIRYVGLYHATRGAHAHFLKMGTVRAPRTKCLGLIGSCGARNAGFRADLITSHCSARVSFRPEGSG